MAFVQASMTRNPKKLLLLTSLVVGAMALSACEITLPQVDCSGIDQPDMGGLVCLGLNAAALNALALLAAAILGLLTGAVG